MIDSVIDGVEDAVGVTVAVNDGVAEEERVAETVAEGVRVEEEPVVADVVGVGDEEYAGRMTRILLLNSSAMKMASNVAATATG